MKIFAGGKMSLWMWTLSFLAVSAPALAADASYDLYSWRTESGTYSCYLIQPSSEKVPDAAVLKASKEAVCRQYQLKNVIMNLPKDAVVTWKEDAAQGLVLPSRDAVNSVKGFAEQLEKKLILPKTRPE